MKKIFAILFTSFLVLLGYEDNMLAAQSYVCTGTVRCKKDNSFVYCEYMNWLVPSANSDSAARKEVYKDCATARGTLPDECISYGCVPLTCSSHNSSISP